MKFNNGSERVRLEKRWKKLRIQYREAGMSEDAIQAMYQFDLDVLNSERAYVDNTQPIFVTEDDEDSVDFKRYEKAITVTDVYHETKNRFAWVGEIKNEHLLAALEKLNAKDLELLTLFAYEGYTVTEISKVLHCSQPTISIKIKRITKFLKNFEFDAMD